MYKYFQKLLYFHAVSGFVHSKRGNVTVGDVATDDGYGTLCLSHDVEQEDDGQKEHDHVQVVVQKEKGTGTHDFVLERVLFQVQIQKRLRDLVHFMVH